MRFSLILGLIMSIAWGGYNTLHGASGEEPLSAYGAGEKNLLTVSFTAYFMKNGKWVDPEKAPQKPLDEPMGIVFNNLTIHSECSLEDLLRTYLSRNYKDGVKKLAAYKVSFLTFSGEMITHVESIPSSAAVSPALGCSESAIPRQSISPMPFDKNYSKSPPPELVVTPVLPKEKDEFTRWNSLLSLKGDELIQVINGKLLKVSFISITDSVRKLPAVSK